MNMIPISQSNLIVSPIILGMMRIASLSESEAERLIETALEAGINHFDHADIYGRGQCESLFGQVVKAHPDWRKKMIIQDKVGIVPGAMYDFSKEHIIEAVEGCLERLGISAIDLLLLHRPDTLVQPEEVAEAFDHLQRSGKVHYFGVSNHTPMQIDLLRTCVKQPLIVNQLQWSLTHTGLTDSGLHMNNHTDAAVCRDGYALDYARIKRMTVQAWSPLQYGFFEGVFIGNEKFAALNKTLDMLAQKYSVTPSAIAIAWLLRHPTSVQAIVGTTHIEHLRAIVPAADITLTREEWYRLYMDAGHSLP
jgi:predicted oxidoreductase